MKNSTLYFVALSALLMNCATAQITIPGVRVPELGIRTDPTTIPTPKADIPGDLAHPERIPGNIGREITNAGRELDRMRIEAGAVANAPILAGWLQQSRNDAIGGSSPIPPNVRSYFVGFYDDDVLNRARYKVGDGGAVNLGNLAISYGDRAAITLIDVIVFSNANDAQRNLSLWAHELRHVQQFRDWGVNDFAIRYLRSWNSVEDEAIAAASNFDNNFKNRSASNSTGSFNSGSSNSGSFNPGPVVSQPRIASACVTPFGACPMAVAIPQGSQCYCPTYQGPVSGLAQ